MSGCNLRCAFCDTPNAWKESPVAKLERLPFSREFDELPNPISGKLIVEKVRELWRPYFHSISITGGEPLLHVEGLREILRAFGRNRPMVYLETNGTLHRSLAQVVEELDIIAMDVKLSSVAHVENQLDNHRDFLALTSPGQAFLKVTISREVSLEELERTLKALSELGKTQTVVLQLVSGKLKPKPLAIEILEQAYALSQNYFQDVRVIPQMHKILGFL